MPPLLLLVAGAFVSALIGTAAADDPSSAEPGPYTITAHGELQDPVEPRVLVGR